ncbi:MAG: beta-1-3, beta-1-6-glucan biosynthesis protein [Pseudolabrys sp.]
MPISSTLRAFIAAFCVLAVGFAGGPVLAQSGNPANPEQQKSAADAAKAVAKEGQKSIDEIAEASRMLKGPAGNPECVWLGRRVVSLLWRDDLDTAFRHLDLYDRFGCPSSHIQATFRCLVRQGHIDPKAQDSLNGRVHACWLNPALEPTSAAASSPPAATSGGTAPR